MKFRVGMRVAAGGGGRQSGKALNYLKKFPYAPILAHLSIAYNKAKVSKILTISNHDARLFDLQDAQIYGVIGERSPLAGDG